MASLEWTAIVQAISSVASAALAYWIARLTSKSVRSADEIVKANQETLRFVREELNEAREERRTPIRNIVDRLEAEMNDCLSRGLEAMTTDELRLAAPRFNITNHTLIRDVQFRDHELARVLVKLYDFGAEAERHLSLLRTAKEAERADLFADELSRVRRTFTNITQLTAAARDRLRRY